MTRRFHTLIVLFVPTLSACYSPNQPFLAAEEGDEASETSVSATSVSATIGESSGSTSPSTTQLTESTVATTIETGDTAETGDSTTSTSDTEPTSGSEGGPGCGNGMLDPGEDCDDGSDNQNGHGCNEDCVISGTVLWTVDYAEDYDVPEELVDGRDFAKVAVAPNGSVYAGGRAILGVYLGVLVTALDEDGAKLWEVGSAGPGYQPTLFSLAASNDLIVRCGGPLESGLGIGFVTTYDSLGGEIWSSGWNAGTLSVVRSCVVLEGGDVLATGNDDIEGRLRRYDGSDGSLVWSDGTDSGLGSALAVRSDGLVSLLLGGAATGPNAVVQRYTVNGVFASELVLDDFIEAWSLAIGPLDSEHVAGLANGSLYQRYDDDVLTWNHIAPVNAYLGLAVDSAGNVIVAGEEDDDIWVRKISAEGDELWTATHAGESGGIDIASSVAVDAADNIYVAGSEVTTDGRRPWLRKYAP